MKPSQVASRLRLIASKIERSRNPDRTLVSRDIKRVLAAMNNLEVSDSPAGPWTSISLPSLATRIESEFNKAHKKMDDMGFPENTTNYASPDDGIILYVRKGDRIYMIADVSVMHGGDAITKYEYLTVDEYGAGTSEEGGSFDDVSLFLTNL